jgi:hypothetical protein
MSFDLRYSRAQSAQRFSAPGQQTRMLTKGEITMMPYSALRRSLLLAVMIGVPAIALGETAAPPNASVYFISPKDGDTVTSRSRSNSA